MDPVTAALVGWLVDRAATAGQRVLARWLRGDKQAKALRPVVSKAIAAAVEEIDVPGDREAVAQALRREEPGTPEIDIGDVPVLRDAVWRLISPRLAVLTDRGYRVDADRLADAITQKIGQGIQLDAVRGGALAPVADLLRHEELKGTGNRIVGAAEDTVRLLKEMQSTWGALSAPGQRRRGAGRCASFLMNRTGAADTSVARDLARELGGLPLALEQAAAYMQATGLSMASYLELFGERRLELLSRGDLTGYDKRVTTTWALAFDQLQTAPQAAGLLRLLACCASEAIPLGLLLRPRPELAAAFGPQVRPLLVPLLDDPLAAADALAALRRYSLVSAPVDGAVSVHRLVQAVTLAQLPPETEAAWQRAAAALIEAALPHEEKLPANWPAYAALMPHARATLAAGSKGMARVAGYLGAIGDRAAALALSQQVLEARQVDLGPEHPETLNAGVEAAGWTGAEGNAAAARDQLAALLRLREEVSGAAHMDTLSTRALLALFTGEAGDPAGARDRYAALLPVAEQALGPEHRAVLTSRGYLARWTGEAGDAAGARDQLAALLPVYERVLGAGHPGTLNARANLAYWTKRAGRSPRAWKDSTPG